MNFNLTPESEEIRLRAEEFFDREMLPRHREWVQTVCHEKKPPLFIKDTVDES